MKYRNKLRHFLQTTFFILIFLTAISKSAADSGIVIPLISKASLHVLCPFGAVVSFYKLATTGTFVSKIHESAMVIFSATVFLSILFGPVFCSWICPLGTLQELTSRIGKKLRTFGKIKVPPVLDKTLSYVRYGVLIWVLYITMRSGQLLFTDYDPYYALFNFWSGEVALSAILILVSTLALALFVERSWCRYACPFGALLGLFNKIRIVKLKRKSLTCITCNACNTQCPMDIEVSAQSTIADLRCISCFKCTSEQHCPIPDTVTLQLGGEKNAN